MKKVLLVIALVAAYGVSIAMSNATVVTVDDTQVTIVADDENSPKVEKGKTKKATKAKSEAKADGCSGTKTKSSADSKAKADGCSGKAKSDCSSSCKGDKKK